MTSNEYLFVYGTLRQGADNEPSRLLGSLASRIGEGRARGKLFLVSTYPGFVPSEGEDDWVYGEVYELQHPELIYPEIDKYEGCGPDDSPPHEYQRQRIPIQLDSGKWIHASAYVYAHETVGKVPIHSGQFGSD